MEVFMSNVKESKELLVAVDKLVLIFIKTFGNGYQAEDLPALLISLTTEPAFMEAIDGITGIKEEIKDLDVGEGFDLAVTVLKAVPGWIEAAKR